MEGLLIDSCVLLDVFEDDHVWADWSQSMLDLYSETNGLYINPIIYTEISIGFMRIEELENAINKCRIKIVPIPHEALFLAGKAYLSYKKSKGTKSSTLPDFFIGAHAAVSKLGLLTRDPSRIKTYFPTVKIISP